MIHVSPGITIPCGLSLGDTLLERATGGRLAASGANIASVLQPDRWVERVVDGVRVVEYAGTSVRFDASGLAAAIASNPMQPSQLAASAVATFADALPGPLGAAAPRPDVAVGAARKAAADAMRSMGADLGFASALDQAKDIPSNALGIRAINAGSLRGALLDKLAPGLADKLAVGFGIEEVGRIVDTALNTALDKGMEVLGGLIEQVASKVLGAAVSLVGGVVSAVASSVAAVGASVGSALGSVVPGLGNLVGATIGALVSAVVNAIVEFFAGLFGTKRDVEGLRQAARDVSEITRDRLLRKVFALEVKIWRAFSAMFDALLALVREKQALEKRLAVAPAPAEYVFTATVGAPPTAAGQLDPSDVIARAYRATFRLSQPGYGIEGYGGCMSPTLARQIRLFPTWATTRMTDARLPRQNRPFSLREFVSAGLATHLAPVRQGMQALQRAEGFHIGRLRHFQAAERVTGHHKGVACHDSGKFGENGGGKPVWDASWYLSNYSADLALTADELRACATAARRAAPSLTSGLSDTQIRDIYLEQTHGQITCYGSRELDAPYIPHYPGREPERDAFCRAYHDCFRFKVTTQAAAAAIENNDIADLWAYRTYVRGSWGVLRQEAARDSAVAETLDLCAQAGLLPPDISYESTDNEYAPGSIEQMFVAQIRDDAQGNVDTASLQRAVGLVADSVSRWIGNAQQRFSIVLEAKQAEVGALSSAQYLSLLAARKEAEQKRQTEAWYAYNQARQTDQRWDPTVAERLAAMRASDKCMSDSACKREYDVRYAGMLWQQACGDRSGRDLSELAKLLLSEQTPVNCLEAALHKTLGIRDASDDESERAAAARVIGAFVRRKDADGAVIATTIGQDAKKALAAALPEIEKAAGLSSPPAVPWAWILGGLGVAGAAGALWYARSR